MAVRETYLLVIALYIEVELFQIWKEFDKSYVVHVVKVEEPQGFRVIQFGQMIGFEGPLELVLLYPQVLNKFCILKIMQEYLEINLVEIEEYQIRNGDRTLFANFPDTKEIFVVSAYFGQLYTQRLTGLGTFFEDGLHLVAAILSSIIFAESDMHTKLRSQIHIEFEALNVHSYYFGDPIFHQAFAWQIQVGVSKIAAILFREEADLGYQGL